MTQLLESVMLVCFGISWPISLAKNIKAKTAKNMSLYFILMIIIGYCAGITAKLITNTINYVLVFYLFNLIVVVCNLIIYFVNCNYDKKNRLSDTQYTNIDVTQRQRQYAITAQEHIYKEMNAVVSDNGIVFFGSDSFFHLSVEELAKTFFPHEPVLNRSLPDCPIDVMLEALRTCVIDLQPSKVFLNIGDADLLTSDFSIDDFITKYSWLLYTIHAKTKASIYIVSILSVTAAAKEANRRLKELAAECGIEFIDASCVLHTEKPYIALFDLLKFYMRSHPISFGDAMLAARV